MRFCYYIHVYMASVTAILDLFILQGLYLKYLLACTIIYTPDQTDREKTNLYSLTAIFTEALWSFFIYHKYITAIM